MKNEAYWIDPEGAILPVGRTHIQEIIDMPERFELTTDEVKLEFLKESEPVGHEGKARNRIMLALIKKGWIRIRHGKKPDGWKIQCWQLDENTRARIEAWISGMQDGTCDRTSGQSEVFINQLSISDVKCDRVTLMKFTR
ncbi:MAG TPA: hypothetical protein VIS94_17385 [Desulfomonilia bacterium]